MYAMLDVVDDELPAEAEADPRVRAGNRARRLAPQLGVDPTLHDREERLLGRWRPRVLAREPRVLREAPRQPAERALHRLAGERQGALPGRDVVELHDHVGAEVALDLHHQLGREADAASVDVALELDPVLVDAAHVLEREHLEAAGVGEDRAVPAHEAVQAAELAHERVAGAEVQVVRVGEDHPGA